RAALGLEAALPALEERLITTLELSKGLPAGTSPELAEALSLSTAARLREVDARRQVDPRPARRRLILGAAALLLLLAYAASDFRGFGQMAARSLHPGRDLPRPSRVGLQVLPGNAVLGLEDDFTVLVRVTRGSPSRVSLRSRVPGGEWRSEDL